MRDKLGRFIKGHPEPSMFKKGRKAPKGKDHPRWKGGRYISSQGYMMILMPKHPFPDHPNGYVKRCRLIMEKKLGRYLKRKEEVHHLNGNKLDDRSENLQLFPNKSEHLKRHKNSHNIKGVCLNTGRTHFKKGCIPWNKKLK